MKSMQKECRTCKGALIDGSIAKAYGYCLEHYERLVNGPEMHAEDYKKLAKQQRNHLKELVEYE